MQVLAYSCLHYGKDYLSYAVRSVYNLVDRFAVLYSSHPSHGHKTMLPCPDSRDELRVAAYSHDPDGKVEWYDGDWWREGDHRMAVMEVWKGEDLILPVDSDEVWDFQTLETMLKFAYKHEAHDYLFSSFVHLWRSFGWACTDQMAPVRLIKPTGSGTMYLPKVGQVYHFGYAQRPETVRYKWSIHGHRNELRPGWYEDVFSRWPERKNDLHPTCKDIWNAEPFDKGKMPPLLRKHPFFGLEVIA